MSNLVNKTNTQLTEEISRLKEIVANQDKLKNECLSLIKNSFDVIWTMDINLIFTYLSPSLENLMGYKPEEWQGKHLSQTISEKEFIEFSEYSNAAIKNNSSSNLFILEKKTKCKDSSSCFIEIRAKLLHDKSGLITGFQGITRNITKRKKIESILYQSQERFRSLTENTSDLIWEINEYDRFTYVSPKIKDLLGYEPIEIIGKTPFSLLSPEVKTQIRIEFQSVKNNRNPIKQIENKNIHKDGRTIILETSGIPIFDKEGNYGGYRGIDRDITKSKKAEKALKKNEAKFRLIAENSKDVICIHHPNGIYKYVSPSCKNVLGYETEELIGINPFELVFPDDINQLKGNIAKVKKGKDSITTYRIRKKSGEYIWFESANQMIKDSSGKIIHSVSTSRDITYRKEAEQKLKTALEKALEGEQLKTAFLDNISHEIRTPMNGIIGFINLLNDPETSDSEKENFSAIINRNSSRLLQTINNIIEISKIDTGQIKTFESKTSINKILNERCIFFSHETNKKGLSLSYTPTLTYEQSTIYTDKHKLHNILTNLIKNAIKFTKKGSITFGYSLKNDLVEFYVKDTGIGVPKDRQKAIFNRFEQADKKIYKGSGLGLAISKAYVEMLGGKIWMESELENENHRGWSKFSFNIPYTKNKIQKTISENTNTPTFITNNYTNN
jgi:PAS domain S-box-containing protein